MPRRNRKPGRPQAIKKVWVEVARKPEDEIDQRELSLALIAFTRSLERRRRELARRQAGQVLCRPANRADARRPP